MPPIFLLAIEHEHGMNYTACATQAVATRELLDYVAVHWKAIADRWREVNLRD